MEIVWSTTNRGRELTVTAGDDYVHVQITGEGSYDGADPLPSVSSTGLGMNLPPDEAKSLARFLAWVRCDA